MNDVPKHRPPLECHAAYGGGVAAFCNIVNRLARSYTHNISLEDKINLIVDVESFIFDRDDDDKDTEIQSCE